jgi:hypothetical protein
MEGEPFKTHLRTSHRSLWTRASSRQMAPLFIAQALRETGSGCAVKMNLMARRLHNQDVRLLAAQLVMPLLRAAEALCMGIARHIRMA